MSKDKEQLITRTIHTISDLHVREAKEGESRTITGYAILFNNESAPMWEDDNEMAVEVIAPDAITKELLDSCDIKMTMFHDRQLILARSRNGEGTLKYNVDDKGVSFEFEAPKTVDGDKALELVSRGDISGCSFAFRTHYWDDGFVKRSVLTTDDKTKIIYTVNVITSINDFTLAADPAYPDTECGTEREIQREYHEEDKTERERKIKNAEQLSDMRRAARINMFNK